MKRIKTSDNCADELTKALGRNLFYCHNDCILGKIIPRRKKCLYSSKGITESKTIHRIIFYERELVILINMSPKKVSWGDIPNVSEVKDKDVNEKWIHCKTCNVKIRIHS